MDNNKKLFEGLLKADGIDPAGISEAERTVFREMLDSEKKSFSRLSWISVGIVWIFVLALFGLCLFQNMLENLRIPSDVGSFIFLSGAFVMMTAMLYLMIKYMPGLNRKIRESNRKVSKLYYLANGKHRGFPLVSRKNGKRIIHWFGILRVIAIVWVIMSLSRAGARYLLYRQWLFSSTSSTIIHLFYCTIFSLSFVIYGLYTGLKAPLDGLTEIKTKPKRSTPPTRPDIWRIIMKSKITKLAATAAIIVVVGLAMTLLDKSVPSAWAIEQTTTALENIETITVLGKSNHIAPIGDFNMMLKRDKDNWDSFLIRAESDNLVYIVNDNIWYEHTLGCGEIYARDMEDLSSFGSKVWSEIINNAPWISPLSPTMLKAAKLVSTNWQETYGKYGDEGQTERDCIFVTGSFKPLSVSFRMTFDLESKLMIQAKYWTNPNHSGTPAVEIEKISYNKNIPVELFEPDNLAQAKIINKEEQAKRYSLFKQANRLVRQKQYREAIEIFQQLHNEYPDFIQTPIALQYIGECYGILGQHEKAIGYFEKVIQNYSVPKKTIADTYRLLGNSYVLIGKEIEALRNFEKGLEFITKWDSEGWRHYRKTYRKDVEERIEKLKNK